MEKKQTWEIIQQYSPDDHTEWIKVEDMIILLSTHSIKMINTLKKRGE